jgi:RimJ/RimL family protein N-acetyltransferase
MVNTLRSFFSQALKMLPTIARVNFGFIRLYATVFDFNQPSMRVLEKAEFTKEGIH